MAITPAAGYMVDPNNPNAVVPIGAPNGGGTGNGGNSSDDFLSQLQDKLMSSAGMVSSDNTALEQGITDAISSVKKAGESSSVATASSFDRQIADARVKGENNLTSAMEASRGYAVNSAAIKQINDETDKQIKDLQQRKMEALASGDSATASKIAELQFQGLQMKMEATQKMFSNLVSIGSFALQKRTSDREQQQQNFQEQQAISGVALKYGLTVKPGDTLQTITARAMPFATAEEKANLQKIQSEIALNTANARKALQGETQTDPGTISLLADSAAKNPAIISQLDTKTAALVLAQVEKNSQPRAFNSAELSGMAQSAISKGLDFNAAKAIIAADAKITNKAEAYQALATAYGVVQEGDMSKLPPQQSTKKGPFMRTGKQSENSFDNYDFNSSLRDLLGGFTVKQ